MTQSTLYAFYRAVILCALTTVLLFPSPTRAQRSAASADPSLDRVWPPGEADSAQSSCLPSQPPAATFFLPEREVSALSTLDLEVEPVASLSGFTVRLMEQDRPASASDRLDVTRTLGQVEAGRRRRVSMVLPAELSRPAEMSLVPRGRSEALPRPKVFLLEAHGTTVDGKEAYSVELITFERGSSGAFRPITLSAYLQKYGSTVGALDRLREEDILDVTGEPTGAAPVERMDRFMDVSGHVTHLPAGAGKAATPAGTITVTVSGYIYMLGSDGISRPAPSVEVAVWEDDGSSAYASWENILLTNSAGYFSTVVSHDDGDNALELFLRVRTINTWVRMGNYYDNGLGIGNCVSGNDYCGLSNENNQYQWDGPLVTGVTGGSQQMDYTIADSRKGAAQIYVWLNEAGDLTRTSYDPGQARAVFGLPDPQGQGPAFSEPDYNYNLVFSSIHGNIGGEDVSYHEHGHLTMYRRNGYVNPNVGGPHFICDLIHPAFAWSEGWATGFAQYINPDGFYNAKNLSKPYAVEDAHTECYIPNTSSEHDEMWVAAAANDFYDLGEPPGGDDPADQVHSFHDVMEIIRTTNIDGLVEFYDALIASSTTTDLEEHYTSRAARYNEFDCCIDLIPEPSPLSVTITGPTELGWKQTGTLTANASGGTGAYTYKWYNRV